MNNKMKKTFILLMVCLIAISLFTGCSPKNAGDNGDNSQNGDNNTDTDNSNTLPPTGTTFDVDIELEGMTETVTYTAMNDNGIYYIAYDADRFEYVTDEVVGMETYRSILNPNITLDIYTGGGDYSEPEATVATLEENGYSINVNEVSAIGKELYEAVHISAVKDDNLIIYYIFTNPDSTTGEYYYAVLQGPMESAEGALARFRYMLDTFEFVH